MIVPANWHWTRLSSKLWRAMKFYWKYKRRCLFRYFMFTINNNLLIFNRHIRRNRKHSFQIRQYIYRMELSYIYRTMWTVLAKRKKAATFLPYRYVLCRNKTNWKELIRNKFINTFYNEINNIFWKRLLFFYRCYIIVSWIDQFKTMNISLKTFVLEVTIEQFQKKKWQDWLHFNRRHAIFSETKTISYLKQIRLF